MDTLVTGEKKPRSGLYTLQFSYMAATDLPIEALEKPAKGKKATDEGGAAKAEDNASEVIDVNPPTEDKTDDVKEHETQNSAITGAEDEDPAVKEARLQAIKKACATEFGTWTLLCRLRFEGDVMGRIKGSVKVKTRPHQGTSAESSTALGEQQHLSNSAASSSSVAETGTPNTVSATGTTVSMTPTTVGDSALSPTAALSSSSRGQQPSSSGTRACIQPDSLWKPSDEVRLLISLDRLDGAVVGIKKDLTNVVIHCHSHVSDGWYVGTASITLSTGQQLKLPRKLRFLLREYNGPRCSKCLDPIDYDPPLTCSNCNCVQYCSEQCREAHSAGHNAMCHTLKPFGGSQGGRAPASFAGAEFFVYWRCVKGCSFELIVDHNNPLGVPYEIQLNPLKDAREGLDYAFLSSPPSSSETGAGKASSSTPQPNISIQELNELNIGVFFAVARSSRDEGALLLTSACLNHLFAYCDCVDNLVLSYFQFYDVCVRDQFEGVRHISCLSEYVMYVRTTYELGQTLLEWALKAPFASLFWQRLVAAKDVLVSLYNFNASLQFAPSIQNIKAILVPDQQRQTLHLLAKIFVVMASRAPKDLAQRLLRRAEECYKDSIDEDRNRNNYKEMGLTCLKLAALATLFESKEDKQKSKSFKVDGKELLKRAANIAELSQKAKDAAKAEAALKSELAATAIANNIAAAAAANAEGGK